VPSLRHIDNDMAHIKTCPVCWLQFEYQGQRTRYIYCSDECHCERRKQRARAKLNQPRTDAQRAKENARSKILRGRDTPEEKAARLLRKRQHYAKNKEYYRATAISKRLANYVVERVKEKAKTIKNKLRRHNDPEYAAHCRKRNNKYRNRKVKTDIQFNLRMKTASRIAIATRRGGTRKVHRTITLLGCTADEFKQYLQKRFTKGMTWAKFLAGEIHIDHIKPCNSFNLTKELELKKCFHYTNCQPLWAMDNFIKGDSIKGRASV
jgi:hypothetical protein